MGPFPTGVPCPGTGPIWGFLWSMSLVLPPPSVEGTDCALDFSSFFNSNKEVMVVTEKKN